MHRESLDPRIRPACVIQSVGPKPGINSKVEAPDTGKSEVYQRPFDVKSKLVRIPIKIRLPPDHQIPAPGVKNSEICRTVMVDTGATRCDVTPSALKKLGFPISYSKKHKLKVKPLLQYFKGTSTASNVQEDILHFDLDFKIGDFDLIRIAAGLTISGKSRLDPEWLRICDRFGLYWDAKLTTQQQQKAEHELRILKKRLKLLSPEQRTRDNASVDELLIGQNLLQHFKHI
jgi:hypothetical protein